MDALIYVCMYPWYWMDSLREEAAQREIEQEELLQRLADENRQLIDCIRSCISHDIASSVIVDDSLPAMIDALRLSNQTRDTSYQQLSMAHRDMINEHGRIADDRRQLQKQLQQLRDEHHRLATVYDSERQSRSILSNEDVDVIMYHKQLQNSSVEQANEFARQRSVMVTDHTQVQLSLQRDHQRLNDDNTRLTCLVDELRQSIAHLQANMKDINDKNTITQRDHDALIESKDNEIGQWCSEVEDLQSLLKDMSAKSSSEHARLVNEYEHKLEQLNERTQLVIQSLGGEKEVNCAELKVAYALIYQGGSTCPHYGHYYLMV
jgi:hypothetical protein